MAISASKATLMDAVNTRAEKGTRVERVPSILYRAILDTYRIGYKKNQHRSLYYHKAYYLYM